MERKAIIDNSTLSAVQRLLGDIVVKNLGNIENDILSFDKLIFSIFMFDIVQYFDDYKEEYKEKRKNRYHFLNSIDDDGSYEKIREIATEYAAKKLITFKGNKPVGEAVRFFDKLNLSPQMRWDIFGSSQYLTLSYLVNNFQEESSQAISKIAAFGNEFSDFLKTAEAAQLPQKVIDHQSGEQLDLSDFTDRFHAKNPDSKGRGSQDTIERIIFGYGWAAERARFYELLAQNIDSTPILSPLRDAYALAVLDLQIPSQDQHLIQNASVELADAVKSVAELTDPTALSFQMPFFSAWAINQTRDPRDAIYFALEEKEKGHFPTIRRYFREYEALKTGQKKLEASKIFKEIPKIVDEINRKYGVKTRNGMTTGVTFSIGGITPYINTATDGLFTNPFAKRKCIFRQFRSIANDLSTVSTLGSLHEKMTCMVKEDKDASYKGVSIRRKFMESRSNESSRPAE